MTDATVSDHDQTPGAKNARAKPAPCRMARWKVPSIAIGAVALVMTLLGAALTPQQAVARRAHHRSATGRGDCNLETMRGVHAIHLTGTMFGLPLAVVGHVTFEAGRRASGIITEVWNGQGSRYRFDGTYRLDSDCRGELRYRAERPLTYTRTFAFYPTPNGKRAWFTLADATAAQDANSNRHEELLSNSAIVLSGDGERLSRKRMTCDAKAARGVYAFHATAVTAAAALLRFTFVGTVELDGKGGVSIRSVGTAPHAVDRHVHYEGNYSVDGGCRGQLRLSGEHFDVRDHHTADFYAAAGATRVYVIFTRTWVDEVFGIGVGVMGINQELAHGNEQEFSYTLTGVAERR